MRNLPEERKLHLTVADFAGFLFLIFILMGCSTCHDSSSTIPDDMKQWYLFQKGSYWICQNDKTHETDSTYFYKDPYCYNAVNPSMMRY
jgi:hypothetical protein